MGDVEVTVVAVVAVAVAGGLGDVEALDAGAADEDGTGGFAGLEVLGAELEGAA